MGKNTKIINILLAVILLIVINFLFILNSCSNSKLTDTVAEGSQSISPNENEDQAIIAANEKEQTNSNENSNSSEEKDNSLC